MSHGSKDSENQVRLHYIYNLVIIVFQIKHPLLEGRGLVALACARPPPPRADRERIVDFSSEFRLEVGSRGGRAPVVMPYRLLSWLPAADP